MDNETRRHTAQGLAVIVVGGSLGVAGVALIVGALAANAILGEDRGGMGSTLVVATVVTVLTTAAGLTMRHILARPADAYPVEARRVDDPPTSPNVALPVGGTAWPGDT